MNDQEDYTPKEFYVLNFRDQQRLDSEYLERWANARSLMLTVPDDARFAINSWLIERPTSACGTAACVAGHCLIAPWFREQGIPLPTMKNYHAYEYHEGLKFVETDDMSNVFGWFGLDYYARTPFDPDIYVSETPTPSMAARCIEAWMRVWWSETFVDAAIAAAAAKYDEDYVHSLKLWVKEIDDGQG